ncbi:hypothetical protein A9P82_09480 [Arachidicoccus ginsenosidimutans]|uniref:hypothetical protein n=1 Tax=Arachidicoccus sp. BS20 TaxID=1850526 RepID=UPI0007F11B2F|nr:hypothetical protein [Arachidicoccus sp. BS20]ANI89499.1 hypothetical protein A9P82_09480 [Arachidicoccus sp. BS20]
MKKQLTNIALLAAVTIMAFSCSKNDSNTSIPDNGDNGMSIGDTISLDNSYTKGYLTLIAEKTFYVGNFTQGTGVNTTDTFAFATKNANFYYSLSGFKGDSTDYDISFNKSYALTVDTSKYKLAFINKSFEDVTDTTGGTFIPTGLAGMNNTYPSNDSVPTASGWYIYNATTHIVQAYSTRTYIITNKSTGDYYKFHIVSMYSGGQPNAATAALNFPYYHFEYMKLN